MVVHFIILCPVMLVIFLFGSRCLFFFKQKTAYEMRISDWSSDVCSSDLVRARQIEKLKRLKAERDPAVLQEALDALTRAADREIGRASCRERVCQYV